MKPAATPYTRLKVSSRIWLRIVWLHFFLALTPLSQADEGMWLLPHIDRDLVPVLDSMGLQMNTKELYSAQDPGLSRAIVLFDEGCTGGLVSSQGLLFTNHHCGFDQIQQLSTLANNYLENGYWASTLEEELPCSGLLVHRLLRIEEVTAAMLNQIPDTLDATERARLIKVHRNQIELEAAEAGGYDCYVDPAFDGNAYFLYVYEVFRDVRLVGTPPSSIGKFGNDEDNWEWPRHSGDFCLFRIYTAPDGSPAEYAPGNIPLENASYFRISNGGVHPGDLTLVLGYPGSTSRYSSSFELLEKEQIINTQRIAIRGLRKGILDEAMAGNPEVALQYAAKYSRSNNYWKHARGQNLDIQRRKLHEARRAEETRFIAWTQEDSVRHAKYGHVLTGIENVFQHKRAAEESFRILYEAIFKSCELIDFIAGFSHLDILLRSKTDKTEAINQQVEQLRRSSREFFRNYHPDTDKKMSQVMLSYYLENVSKNRHPQFFQKRGRNQNPGRISYKLFNRSFFTSPQHTEAFLQNPSTRKLHSDYGFRLANSIYQRYIEEYALLQQFEEELEAFRYLYTQGRMLMEPDTYRYPDADLNPRLSYGSVKGYRINDSIQVEAQTYLSELIAKGELGKSEYQVPAKLKWLYAENNFMPYTKGRDLPLCFSTTNDITGGSSGSPVINGQGQLTGIAFDGNWEALGSDFQYHSEWQRCICVDMRYVLFIIDKFAGAERIINELQIPSAWQEP